jgi:hypothetical protein
MYRVLVLAFAVACGRDASPATSPQASDPCAAYRAATAQVRNEHGDVQVDARNACGCSVSLKTTPRAAAVLRDAEAQVTAANARCSVNCDQPCGANDSRW